MNAKKTNSNYHTVAQNRRARYDYEILETIEAGIMLMGSEVKSLRVGKCSINEAFVGEMVEEGRKDVGIYLINATISEYTQAKNFGHTAKRPRRLLVHKRQMNKLLGSVRKKGMTIVPLSLYFNNKGFAKIEIALAKGKKTHDKRETIKERDWSREKSRILKGNL